jgi:hypothetical protein
MRWKDRNEAKVASTPTLHSLYAPDDVLAQPPTTNRDLCVIDGVEPTRDAVVDTHFAPERHCFDGIPARLRLDRGRKRQEKKTDDHPRKHKEQSPLLRECAAGP